MTSALTPRGGTWRWRNVIRPAILNRDAGMCWICGEGGADSVDHVLPRAQGGTDDPDNLKAAHMGCNNRRGNEPNTTGPVVPSRKW